MSCRTAEKAKQAIGALMPLMSRSKMTSWTSRIHLFESLVTSVLTNCIPVWGLRYCDILERVQLAFLKRVLLLPTTSPDFVIRLEAGRVKLSYVVLKHTIKWMIKLLEMDDSRLPEMCFLRLRELSSTATDSRYNWALQVKQCLEALHINLEWPQITNNWLKRNKKLILSNYLHKLRQEDIALIQPSSYLTLYSYLKIKPSSQDYLQLQLPIQFTRTLAQLRLSNKYFIKFTFKGCSYRINPQEICTICNKNELETLHHILFECPIYVSIKPKNSECLNNADSLINALNNITPPLAKAICLHIWNIIKLRSFIINE